MRLSSERIFCQRNRFDFYGFDPVFRCGFGLFDNVFSSEDEDRFSAAGFERAGDAEAGIEVSSGSSAADGESGEFH